VHLPGHDVVHDDDVVGRRDAGPLERVHPDEVGVDLEGTVVARDLVGHLPLDPGCGFGQPVPGCDLRREVREERLRREQTDRSGLGQGDAGGAFGEGRGGGTGERAVARVRDERGRGLVASRTVVVAEHPAHTGHRGDRGDDGHQGKGDPRSDGPGRRGQHPAEVAEALPAAYPSLGLRTPLGQLQ